MKLKLGNSMRTLVSCLLDSSRPSAVGWSIGPVVVDALDRHAMRRLAHVGVEVFELPPTLADRDSATSVVFELPILRVSTPAKHLTPSMVDRAFTHSVRSTSGNNAGDDLATAGSGVSTHKIATPNGFLRSAIASHIPHELGAAVLLRRARHHRQDSESLPCGHSRSSGQDFTASTHA